MKNLLQQTDEIPVTLLVAIAYVTLAFLTDPGSPTNEQLHRHGWLMATLVSDHEPWRLLTNAFLHGGWMHLGFNTYALLSIGPSLERSLGSIRMAVLYLVSALGASITVCLISSPFQPVVGGSGALFGMIGAVIALQMRSGRSALGFLEHEGPRRTIRFVLLYLIIGIFVPFLSNSAHVGGLVTGFGLTFLFMTPSNKIERWMPAWRAAYIALIAGCLFHTLKPATRFDWLWRQSIVSSDPQRAEDLLRAATMSAAGESRVTNRDMQTLDMEMRSFEAYRNKLNTK